MSNHSPCLTGAFVLPEASYYGSSKGIGLGDRVAGKLGDALFLLDEVLETIASECSPRIDDIARHPVERARDEVNRVMKQLAN